MTCSDMQTWYTKTWYIEHAGDVGLMKAKNHDVGSHALLLTEGIIEQHCMQEVGEVYM